MTHMIRHATAADIPQLVAMGRGFHAQTGAWAGLFAYDPASVDRTMRHLIDTDAGLLLVAERDGAVVGMAGALLYPMWLNAAHRTGQELFWWVEPEHRDGLGGALLRALEQAARMAGAQSFTMICEASLRPEALDRVYRRAGYRPVERSYVRGL